MLFDDRRDAGRFLAERLKHYAGKADVLVLGLPRGGVPVAFEIASRLRAPLDVFVVRKLGVPQFRELAMGAIATGGVRVVNQDVVDSLGIAPAMFEAVAQEELKELERRQKLYAGDRRPEGVAGRRIILVDDGLATGSSMRAAVLALKKMQPAAVIAAVPVAAEESLPLIRPEVDDFVCASTPRPFFGVGAWYRSFDQTSDEEVRELLEQNAIQQAAEAKQRPASPGWKGAGPA